MDELTLWLQRYPWFKRQTRRWQQVTHRLAYEITPERIVGMDALLLALANMDVKALFAATDELGITGNVTFWLYTLQSEASDGRRKTDTAGAQSADPAE
jgi:hypothetical protein